MTDEGYLGEFRRGPAIFTVFQTDQTDRTEQGDRTDEDPAHYRVDCNDGNGPSEVCTFSNHPGSGPKWHGAWNGDEWCAWIELEARKVVKEPDR